MARKPARVGKISTYFSYKGGVGRTMALANVGFLAALAGKRVLLMDWDLEAPGLAVYFRGITEHKAALDIRKAHGVLDLFSEWRDDLLDASGPDQVTKLFDRFASGKPFDACACPLVPANRLPKTARLDLIGAGSALIGTREPTPYAEALSRFHWPTFFAQYAGGAMLQALRSWAKRNYDLVLIDSRTGLADVAGICTMQLPDEVVLCFVLNRQNTEGVADIAASIRAARNDEVAIRLSPMRVSKDRPTEEADARARAQREMRNAGLDPAMIEKDMVTLSIAAAPNVPFYETLAPFVARNSSADPLTFEYLRMAQELTGNRFDAPQLDPAWVEAVRRRLQPRMTTIEYLGSLESADPDRAYEELDRFLDGALDADPNRELDADYVAALVQTALDSADWGWSEENKFQPKALPEKAILLLRQLHSISDGDWRVALIEALDDFEMRWTTPTVKELLKRNSERDEILADGHPSPDILLRRARMAVYNSRLRKIESDLEAIEDDLTHAERLIGEITGPLQDGEAERLAVGEAEIVAQRARVAQSLGERELAGEYWQHVVRLVPQPQDIRADGARARNLFAEASLALAVAAEIAGDLAKACEYVLSAVRVARSFITRDIETLSAAVKIIVASPEAPTQALAFTHLAFGRNRAPRSLTGFRSYELKQTAALAQLLEQLVINMGDGASRKDALLGIVDAAENQLHRTLRFAQHIDAARSLSGRKALLVAYLSLYESLIGGAVPESALDGIRQRLDTLRGAPRRSKT